MWQMLLGSGAHIKLAVMTVAAMVAHAHGCLQWTTTVQR